MVSQTPPSVRIFVFCRCVKKSAYDRPENIRTDIVCEISFAYKQRFLLRPCFGSGAQRMHIDSGHLFIFQPRIIANAS